MFVSRFDIEGKPHVLRFVDALSTVLINGQPIKVEFGGLPKPIVVRGKKHFIRFTVLPRDIKPGYISIVNMEGGRLPSPPQLKNENSDTVGFGGEDSSDTSGKLPQGHDPVLPIVGKCLFPINLETHPHTFLFLIRSWVLIIPRDSLSVCENCRFSIPELF